MQEIIKYLNSRRKKLNKKVLPLHEPEISKKDQLEVIAGLKTGFVSTAGKDVITFENQLKKITKTKNVTSTINGTSALDIALKIVGVGKEDEVLLPTISFVAPANAVLYNNAIPHFIDSEPEHFGVDPEKLEAYLFKNTKFINNICINIKTNRKIKALLVVHIFGHPAKIVHLKSIAKKYNLKLIEDAAEALGSFYKKKHVGTFGDVGILSFNGNKIITTGVGGAILTNKKELGNKARHLVTTAKIKQKWDFIHDMLGYNYRLANLNATLGISQLKKLSHYIKIKRKAFKRLNRFLKNSKDYYILNEPKNCKSNFWLQTLVINRPSKVKRDKLLMKFHKNKILARPVWKPLHKLKYFKKYPKMDLTNSKKIENSIINIPSSFYL